MTLPEPDLRHVLQHMHSWDKLRGKRIFLTGASGFVGTWLTETFAFANLHLSLDAELVPIPRNSLPKGDFNLGIHAAKADDFDADIAATKRMLAFAAERGVSRLLLTSSGAVYGKLPAAVTHVAEDFPCAPETSYAKAKHLAEQLCAESPIWAVIARMFAFSGPALPLNANFAIGNFIRDVLTGQPVIIQGDGTARRSYLYAADLAIWLWTLLLSGHHARPYNVGSQEPVSILQLAQTIVATTDPRTRIVVLGKSGFDTYVPSANRVQTELQLNSLISLTEGIQRMYAWNLATTKEK